MFTLNLVTPEKKLVTDAEVDEVIVPGHNGQLGVFPGHSPLVTTLSVGVLKYRLKGSSEFQSVVVSWGYCEINKDGVIVLAETAETPSEIDKARAEAALRNAQEKLVNAASIEADQMVILQRKLERAQARLHLTGGNETNH